MTADSRRPSGDTSPTLRRRMLAAELKRLRLDSKKSRDEAAKHINLTGTAITRFEAATTPPALEQVLELLDLYGVTGTEHERLVSLARDTRKKDWWQPHREAIPSQYEFFFGLETEATEIRSYEMGLIPGLLQTADYYRSFLLTPPAAFDADDIDGMIKFRLARQQRRLTATGPRMHWILDEAILHRHVGGPDVMRAQLAHLQHVLAEHPQITLQVLPFAAGSHQALDGSFQIMEFAEEVFGDVVYLESKAEGRYLEDPPVVEGYNLVFSTLAEQALPVEESVALLGRTERI